MPQRSTMQLELQDVFHGCSWKQIAYTSISIAIAIALSLRLYLHLSHMRFLYKALPRKWSNVVLGKSNSLTESLPQGNKEGIADRVTQWQPLINFSTLFTLAVLQEVVFQLFKCLSNGIQWCKLQSSLRGLSDSLIRKGSCILLSGIICKIKSQFTCEGVSL